MPLREDLLTPIPGSNPSGINLRYDPVTDKVKEARREDQDLPQGQWKATLKTADWSQVIKLAGDALAKKGKDLQLAVWLVEGHLRKEGFVSLPPGFRFLAGLVNDFWDTLYPEIEEDDMEMRAAPLEWLGTKLDVSLFSAPLFSKDQTWLKFKESRSVGFEDSSAPSDKQERRRQMIKEGKITAEEFDAAMEEVSRQTLDSLYNTLGQSREELDTLGTLCDEKFGGFAPSFTAVKSILEEIHDATLMYLNRKGGPIGEAAPAEEEPAPEPAALPVREAAPPPPPPPAAAPVAQRAPAPAAQSVGLEPSSPEDAAQRLAAIANYLRKKDVWDLTPYLLLRAARWGELLYNGKTPDASAFQAPNPRVRAELESAVAASRWDDVLNLTESAMATPAGRSWLDLQQYTAAALRAKDGWFPYMAEVIESWTRALLTVVPQLPTLNFPDGQAVASQSTRAWVETVTAGLPAPAPQPVAPAAPAFVEPPPAPEPDRSASGSSDVSLTEAPPLLSDDEAAVRPEEQELFERALAQARSGKFHEAVAALNEKLALEKSGRARFLRRVQLAHVVLAAGRRDAAYAILDDLSREIDERHLEGWEPGSALAYPLVLLLRCLRAQKADEEARQRVFERICRLDPLQAFDAGE